MIQTIEFKGLFSMKRKAEEKMNSPLKEIERNIKLIEKTIFSLNVNLEKVRQLLPKFQEKKEITAEIDELIQDLKKEGEDEEIIEMRKNEFLKTLELFKSLVQTFYSYGENIFRLQRTLVKLAEHLNKFRKIVGDRYNNQTITIEKYRILSQLGEMDSKVLTLLLNGVSFEAEFLEEISTLRRAILSDEKTDVTELQERFNKLYKRFADIFEDSARQLASYQKEAKKFIQNMRDVAWM